MIQNRKIWIDWFKVLAMVCIIWGHMFPYYFTDFVYSFSVPAFFWASGYLTKTQTDSRLFMKRIWSSLIVPFLLVCLVNLVLCITLFHDQYMSVTGILKSFMAILLGIQSFPDNSAIGVGAMWFVYSLVLIKVIHHFINRRSMVIVSLLFLIFVQLYQPSNCYWASASILLCLPFFTLGLLCQDLKLESFILKKKTWASLVSVLAVLAAITVLWFMTSINHAPYLYKLGYGNSVILFILNASIGIMILSLISMRLEVIFGEGQFIKTLNVGMIIILGFQRWFVLIVTYIIKPRIVSHFAFDAISAAMSILILVLFLPVITVISNYFPAFLGYRTIKYE